MSVPAILKSEGISKGRENQNYFHNITKRLVALFILIISVYIDTATDWMQKQKRILYKKLSWTLKRYVKM